MLKDDKFDSLYRDELRDLYDAERQIVEALPDMAHAASSDELKTAFEAHLAETKEQLRRLERLFAEMNDAPGGKPCQAMRALLSEGRQRISEYAPSPVLDAALIGAAQKVEHYEISGYGTARALAEMLGHENAAKLLQITLDEEEETDSYLTEIAETLLGGEELEDAEAEEEEMAS